MPVAALVIAGLAVVEPRPAPPRTITLLETRWVLTASPVALAAGQPQGPLIGPGQVIMPIPRPAVPEPRPRQVIVQPAEPDAADVKFDDLVDPAAPAAQTPAAETPPAADGAAASPEAAAQAPADAQSEAVDPLEAELASQIKPERDPLEGFNRVSFSISMAIDKAVLRPVAIGFQKVVPKPVRDGMRNVLSNLGEPMTLLNDLLQLKPKRAARTLGRFLLNTIFGLGGLFDIAKDKKIKLPHHPNRLSDTLGFYGIKPGPYIYIPILGPTTLRDQVDRVQGLIPLFDNTIYGGHRGTAFAVVNGLEERANNDADLKSLLADAVDPYATFRTTWLQQRQGEIEALKAPDGTEPGSVEANPLDDALEDPAAGSDPAPETPATPAP